MLFLLVINQVIHMFILNKKINSIKINRDLTTNIFLLRDLNKLNIVFFKFSDIF